MPKSDISREKYVEYRLNGRDKTNRRKNARDIKEDYHNNCTSFDNIAPSHIEKAATRKKEVSGDECHSTEKREMINIIDLVDYEEDTNKDALENFLKESPPITRQNTFSVLKEENEEEDDEDDEEATFAEKDKAR